MVTTYGFCMRLLSFVHGQLKCVASARAPGAAADVDVPDSEGTTSRLAAGARGHCARSDSGITLHLHGTRTPDLRIGWYFGDIVCALGLSYRMI